MGSLTSRPVTRVSARPGTPAATYTESDLAYDYVVGGLPFLAAISDKYPLQRRTADYKKDQIDTTAEPGEQTLTGWWLRSQSSFHAGTGIIYEEPTSQDPTIQYRFQDSAGVNVWTPGKVTLLKATTKNVTASGVVRVMGAVDSGGVDCYFQAEGATLKRAVSGSSASVTWGGAGTILSLCNDGTNYYAADATSIYKGTLLGGAGAALWSTGTSPVVLGWVKQRLVAGIGNKFYELAGGTPPTLPTAKFTHQNTNWTWTSITEGPAAIYAAGYVGNTSAIYKFTLSTTDGSVPTLSSGITTAQLPEGEIVYSIYGYLGSYLVIGTNRGVRVADINTNGDLQYGPLSVVLPSTALPVRALVGRDRFIYGAYGNGISGNSGLFRLDLGTSTGLRKFAWASDLQAHVTGEVQSVELFGNSDRLLFTVDANGSYLESASTLEPTGTLTTGNIRFHMLEPKLFKYVRVRTLPLTKGGVSISVIDRSGNATSLVTFSSASAVDPLDEVAFPTSFGPQEYVALQVTLTRDADTTSSPTVTSYQVKALPAQKRQRVFQVPLLCFDYEKDRNGVQHGTEGGALTRLQALETLEEAGDFVNLQDLTRHPMSMRSVIIDGIDFIQTAPPKNASGWGGVAVCTLRSVT